MTVPSRASLRDPLPAHPRVAVVGMGATGFAAARLLQAMGKDVVVADRRADLDAALLPPGCEVRTRTNDVGDVPIAVLSPGLNPDWPEHRAAPDLGWAYRAGQRLPLSEVELAAAAWTGAYVSIGGTDGKSTTAALTAALLQLVDPHAQPAGNSWTPWSQVLVDAHHNDAVPSWLAVEVSAFQLWTGCSLSPAVAILTNIAPDHLDHYAGEDEYIAAKLRIFDGMQAGGIAVLALHDPRLAALATPLRARGLTVLFYTHTAHPDPMVAQVVDGCLQIPLPTGGVCRVPTQDLTIPGPHNQRNALAAWVAAAWATRSPALADPALVAPILTAFRGLPHRVQHVRTHQGVMWFDDSKATNVHAAVIGIRAMQRPLVAIVGGVDKGLDLDPLVAALREHARAVVLIGGVRERLTAALGDAVGVVQHATSMEDAVAQAAALAAPGMAVLLAPAASSFDMFSGFEARGRAFQAAVAALD